jgi:hypothetical protein
MAGCIALLTLCGSIIALVPYRTITEEINRRDGTVIRRERIFLLSNAVTIEDESGLNAYGSLSADDVWVRIAMKLQRFPWSPLEVDMTGDDRLGMALVRCKFALLAMGRKAQFSAYDPAFLRSIFSGRLQYWNGFYDEATADWVFVRCSEENMQYFGIW